MWLYLNILLLETFAFVWFYSRKWRYSHGKHTNLTWKNVFDLHWSWVKSQYCSSNLLLARNYQHDRCSHASCLCKSFILISNLNIKSRTVFELKTDQEKWRFHEQSRLRKIRNVFSSWMAKGKERARKGKGRRGNGKRRYKIRSKLGNHGVTWRVSSFTC